MATSWPEHTLVESHFKDVSQLAQVFELHCAKIYAHAANNPDHPASADYVREFVSQAYRAVHSLNMQNVASSCLDLEVATATLDDKAKEYYSGPELLPPTLDAKPSEPVETLGQINETQVGVGLEDLLTGDFEDDDSEEDSDWEESESDDDDEYYEYCSGSEAELDLDELEAVERTATFQNNTQAEKKEGKEKEEEKEPFKINVTFSKQEDEEALPKDETPSPPPVSIVQDQAMHDRITAALRTLPLPCHESELEEVPLARVETHIPRPATRSTVSPIDDTQSEATAVQTESNQETQCTTAATAPAGNLARKSSFDAKRLQRKLSMRSSPAALPRRLKTVCYKYVRKAMVPIRGPAN